jgi:peptidoglycan/xylan/chitin deacetylase (PgdA/CDA1 family)
MLLLLCTARVAGAASGASNATAPMRVAVTVDDLPAHSKLVPGTTRISVARAVLKALHDNGIRQAYGFSNGYMEKWEPGVNQVFKLWLEACYPLGNHTFDHTDLDKLSAQDYIANIAEMDRLLQTYAPGEPLSRRRTFRYPYLEEGDTLEKRDAVRNYLFRNGYRIAEETFDYTDYAWNDAYVRCVKQNDQKSVAWLKINIVEDAEWHLHAATSIAKLLFRRNVSQILVVHVGAFDAVMLDAILKDFRAKDVKFITLDEALRDPVYRIDPQFVSGEGKTFLEQIAAARHVDIRRFSAESVPGYPYRVEKLEQVCPQQGDTD